MRKLDEEREIHDTLVREINELKSESIAQEKKKAQYEKERVIAEQKLEKSLDFIKQKQEREAKIKRELIDSTAESRTFLDR